MRIIAAILAFFVVFGEGSAQTLRCDFNDNDMLDIHDVVTLVNYLSHSSPFDTLEQYWPLGDCDCDSAHLTVADLFSLRNKLLFGENAGHGRRLSSSLDTLSMPDMLASPGQLISIPIVLATSDSIRGFQFYIRFDPSLLQYIGLASVDSLGPGLQPYTIDGGVAQYYSLPRNMILGQTVAWASFRVNPDLIPPLSTFLLFAENINHAVYSCLARVNLEAVPPDSEITFVRPVRKTSHISIVEAGIEDDIPNDFDLGLMCYPNPFNNSITIEYSLESASPIRLDIFDISGKRVAVLSGEMQSRGTHRVVWNAEGFSSGIYFARLEASDRAVSAKLLLLK